MMIISIPKLVIIGRRENLEPFFQSFIDANVNIEKSNLEEKVKIEEKVKVLQSRKLTFGADFRKFPPWK